MTNSAAVESRPGVPAASQLERASEFRGGGFTAGQAEDFSDFFESLFGEGEGRTREDARPFTSAARIYMPKYRLIWRMPTKARREPSPCRFPRTMARGTFGLGSARSMYVFPKG
jgi:hypothetical protein